MMESEWLKQADLLAYLFARELGQSREQYQDFLPKLFPQPDSYRARFTTPLLVQPPIGRLTIVRMLEVAEIVNYLPDLNNLKDWQKDPQNFRTPNIAYAVWLHDGSRNLKRSPKDIRGSLASDERGGTYLEGVTLVIQYPDISRKHYLDLPGSQYGSGNVPCLDRWLGQIGLSDSWDDGASFFYGSVVAGRQIVTK